MYVGSFPNQPHSPEIMLRQVGQWCLGKPSAVLAQMCNPNFGAVTRSDKPCLKSLNAWFEDWVGKDKPPAISHYPPLPEPEPISEEERQRNAMMLRKCAEQIRKTVKAKCVGRPMKPIQKAHRLDELAALTER